MKGAGKLPRAVLVIAILSFVEAGIWTIPVLQALNHELASPRALGAFLLLCAAAATAYGLVQLMGWARILKVAIAAVDAVVMISVAQDAFREDGLSEVMWIVMFIYIIWSALYMFTPGVKRAFSKAA